MTIEIPEDLTRQLREIAAARRTSVESLALEGLRTLTAGSRSPQDLLRAIRKLPHPSPKAIDDLDTSIAAARLPVREDSDFEPFTLR